MFGTLQNPSVRVHSNIADAVAKSLKNAVGAEVARAEQMVRAKVDSLVGEGRRQVEERVAGLQNEVQAKVTEQRGQLEQAKAELETRVKTLTPPLPGGIRLPR
jgi:vacuolar-type H+-ATPase subunit E/Vma4